MIYTKRFPISPLALKNEFKDTYMRTGKETLILEHAFEPYFEPIEVPKYVLCPPDSGKYDSFVYGVYNNKAECFDCIVIDERYMESHLKHLWNNRTELLQEKLASGTLYEYLEDIQEKAENIVESQVEKWKETDKEIKAAKATGNILLEYQLTNNLIARAEEIVNSTLIYV